MSNFSRKILRTLTIFLIPLIIILGMVRLLATDIYLAYEYGKPSFPHDPYGFTAQQRFILASTNIHYVRAHLPDNELSKQILNGSRVYNEREVAHMADYRLCSNWFYVYGSSLSSCLFSWNLYFGRIENKQQLPLLCVREGYSHPALS